MACPGSNMTDASSTGKLATHAILKERDAWWTVLVVDPVAMRILPSIARWSWVSPMRLTALAALLGIASTVWFATGHFVVAAILFELRFFIDCLDGKLARLRRLNSPRGAYFDFGCDVVLIGSNLAALGWVLAKREELASWLAISVVALSLVLFWFQVYHQWYPPSPGRAAPGAGMLFPARPSLFTRWKTWFAAHRLVYAPRTVEIETLVLFIAPLTGNTSVMAVGFGIALLYYAVATTRLAVLVYQHVPATASTGAQR